MAVLFNFIGKCSYEIKTLQQKEKRKNMKPETKKQLIRGVVALVVALIVAMFTKGRGTAPLAEGTVTSHPTVEEGTIVEAEETGLEGDEQETSEEQTVDSEPTIDKDASYTDKDNVALYIHTYGHLPSNYITKAEAEKLGWNSKEGNLPEVAPGKSIGGSHFSNYDGTLPEAKGRKYKECDIDYEGGHRNAKRIIFSNDGLIFYTGDHYETFEQLY